jgi:hypothetical protein
MVFGTFGLLALIWLVADVVGLATLNVVLIAIATPLVALFAWGCFWLRPARLRRGASSNI